MIWSWGDASPSRSAKWVILAGALSLIGDQKAFAQTPTWEGTLLLARTKSYVRFQRKSHGCGASRRRVTSNQIWCYSH